MKNPAEESEPHGARFPTDANALVAQSPAFLAAMSSIHEVFDFVRKSIPVLFPGSTVLLYRSVDDGESVELLEIFGLEGSLVESALRILKFEPRGRTFRVEDRFREIYGRTALYRLSEGLADFSSSALPASAAMAVQRLLGVRAIYAIGLAHGDKSFGAINVFVRGRDPGLQKDAIESFAHQCFLAMSGIRAMQRLRESEERHRTLLDSLPVAVQVVRKRRLVYCNPASIRLYGFATPEDAFDREVTSLVVGAGSDEFAAWIERSESHAVEPLEVQAVRCGGDSLPVEMVAEAIRYDDAPAILLIGRDLRQQKEAEQARLALERNLQRAQRLEGLGVLAGGVAHEFNNALTIVLGNLAFVSGDLAADSPVQRDLAEARASASRLVDIAKQMLIYAGQGVPKSDLVDISQVVRDVMWLFRTAMPKGSALDADLPPALPRVRVDSNQLQQVVLNLVNNAAEALSGVGRVTVKTGTEVLGEAQLEASCVHPNPKPGRFVFVEVGDSGAGMEADVILRMFDPFFSTKFAGRGLGLAAVYGIVQRHQGAIFVRSAPSQGTCVRVLLPAIPDGTADETSWREGPENA